MHYVNLAQGARPKLPCVRAPSRPPRLGSRVAWPLGRPSWPSARCAGALVPAAWRTAPAACSAQRCPSATGHGPWLAAGGRGGRVPALDLVFGPKLVSAHHLSRPTAEAKVYMPDFTQNFTAQNRIGILHRASACKRPPFRLKGVSGKNF